MGKDHGTTTCTAIDPLAESREVTTHGSGYTHLTPGLSWTLLANGHNAATAWVMALDQNAVTPPTFDDFTIAGPF